MNPSLEEEVLRLHAQNVCQSAEISALAYIYLSLRDRLAPAIPELPTLSEDFVRERKKSIQAQLELIEKTRPEFAARLQALIDSSSTILPVDYD
jgi:hypothetical protein